MRTFNLEELALLNQAVAQSEALVALHFRIPKLPSHRYPYELSTAADQGTLERADDALAHLVVYERPRATAAEPLYRICLQDENILGHAQDGGDGWLAALLVYIVTHELVHVVRFQRAEQTISAEGEARQAEEEVVHQITLSLLESARAPHVNKLAALYGNPVVPAQVTARCGDSED